MIGEIGICQAIETLVSNISLKSFHSFLSEVGDCLKFLSRGQL